MPNVFSVTPRYWANLNLTLPSVNAASTAELTVTANALNTGAKGGSLDSNTFITAHPVVAGANAVAFPAGLTFSHAYMHSDGTLRVRFSNVTAVNYTAADVVTFHVVGF